MKSLKILYTILILSMYNGDIIYCQQNLSKAEILDYYLKFNNKQCFAKDSIKIVRFNPDLEVFVKAFIDSLEKKNIDTVIVYSISYPGNYAMIKNIECIDMLYPIDVFIFWKYNHNYFQINILNGCISEFKKSKGSLAFEYYTKNQSEISNDIIMPVLYSAILKEDSTMLFSWISSSHEPIYSLYLKWGE